MSGTLLRVILLLIVIILFLVGGILYLNRKSDNAENSYTFGGSQASSGFYSVDESKTAYILYAQLSKVSKEDGKVWAEGKVKIENRNLGYKTVIFDNQAYRGLSLILADSKEDLNIGETIRLIDDDDAYQRIKQLEGKLVQFSFELKSTRTKSLHSCNQDFLDLIQGGNNRLDCAPVAYQISAYVD